MSVGFGQSAAVLKKSSGAGKVGTRVGRTVQDDIDNVAHYAADVVDVLIVYGQSNARGYAANSAGEPVYKVPLARVWDGSSFQAITSYTPTANDGVSTGSAWLAFANEYCQKTGRKLVVINAAKGSQSIAELAKGGANYTAMQTFYDDAVVELASEGSTVGKTFVAFNQGEADAAAGTTPAAYYSALVQLWSDLRVDTAAELLALFTVGYYADSRLIHGQVIQQAQRLFVRDTETALLAYDQLGGFGSHNKMKVDGVHYNQRGYNVMGREGAARLVCAAFPDTGAGASDQLIARFGGLGMNQSQAWNLHAGVLRKTAVATWGVNHTTPNASSLLVSVEELSDRLRVKLAGPARTIMNFSANLGGDLQKSKMLATVGESINAASNIAGSVDADGYSYVDVFFACDVYLRINMATQAVDVDAMGAAFAGILSEISATFPSTGRVDITHPTVKGLAVGAVQGSTARNLRVNPGATTTIVVARDAADAQVNDTITVLLPNMIVPPSALPVIADLSVQVIAADYAVW